MVPYTDCMGLCKTSAEDDFLGIGAFDCLHMLNIRQDQGGTPKESKCRANEGSKPRESVSC